MTWTGWRGPDRDGHVLELPKSLPAKPIVEWQLNLPRAGLGGIAATDDYVVFGDRDLADFQDVWQCLDAATGRQLWEVSALAIGELDYGNSPRATPLLAREVIDGHVVENSGRAYLLGALGDLLAVELATGAIVWQKNLRTDFAADGERPWGYCGSPLLVDNKLIVNPGAADASLVALDPVTGDVIWTTPGENVGYGSPTVATLGGKRQIVCHDAVSLGGWDVETGERLWTLKPPLEGDFNVPTPLPVDGRLLVTTENNGTRLYEFDDQGRIKPTPVARNDRLTPDMSTPVVVGNRLFCVDAFLYCLDVTNRLREVCRLRDPAFGDFAAVLADESRVLVVGKGQVLLIDASSPGRIVSRWQVFPEQVDIYSHAAIVGERLFVRGETKLLCLKLK